MPNRTANRLVGFRRCRGAPDHVGHPGVAGQHLPALPGPGRAAVTSQISLKIFRGTPIHLMRLSRPQADLNAANAAARRARRVSAEYLFQTGKAS
jgi:hypothetical protein